MKKTTIRQYSAIAEGIGALLHPLGAVVMHNFETNAVAHLANNFSNQKKSTPSPLTDIDHDSKSEILGPYKKMNRDGRESKSISIFVKEGKERVGLLCINVDVSHFKSATQILDNFLNPQVLTKLPEPLFKDDWQERINVFIYNWIKSWIALAEAVSR